LWGTSKAAAEAKAAAIAKAQAEKAAVEKAAADAKVGILEKTLTMSAVYTVLHREMESDKYVSLFPSSFWVSFCLSS
jgi:hypothetical protein